MTMKKKYTKYAVIATLLVFISFGFSLAVINHLGKPVSTYSGNVKVTIANGQIAGSDLYELPSTSIKKAGSITFMLIWKMRNIWSMLKSTPS